MFTQNSGHPRNLQSLLKKLSANSPVDSKKRLLAVVFLGLPALLSFMAGSDWESDAELHTIFEVVATLLALCVGAMALVRYYSLPENKFLIIGVGFLGTAFLDGYHAVVTSPRFYQHMPSTLPSLIPWSWIASRLFLAISLFIAWYVWSLGRRKRRVIELSPSQVYWAGSITTLFCFMFFAVYPLPAAYHPNAFLHMHRPQEFVPALLFLAGFIGFVRKGLWKFDAFEFWLLLCLLVNFFGEAAVMVFSNQLYDARFDFAHLLKNVSYGATLIGLFISMYASFIKLRNITGREVSHIRELKIREKKLTAAYNDLESFSYSVSHDLRAPLRAIDGFVAILQEDYRDKLDDEGKRLFGIVSNNAQRMSRLIDDILMFSRAGRMELSLEIVSMNNLVDDVWESLSAEREGRDIRLEKIDLPDAYCDVRAIRQVWQNLISNAIKFSRGRSPAIIQIGGIFDGKEIRYQVSDNGVGFNMEYSNKLFGLFQRLHGMEEFDGTGVGLALVKRFVEKHNGHVEGLGKLNEGATFYFTIPVQIKSEGE